MSLRPALCLLGLSVTLTLAGCGTAGNTASNPIVKAGINGIVHGGQQPVGYATVQLYTVGTTGDGSAATPMLTQTVQSDGSGNFSITGDYSCTNSSATQVYLTATGGQPTAYSTNANLAMMVALGPCSALTPNTYVTINELTTVAAVSALQPYMTGIAAIGSSSSDAALLTAAMTLASEFVSVAAGSSPGGGVPVGYTVPSTEINTLGDIIAACINSAGGHAGDGTACGTLFTLTTVNNVAPTNTIAALRNIANSPTSNTTALFDSAPTISPFQPTLSTPPANFTIALQATIALTVTPASLSFGPVTQGYPSTAQIVSLQNTGATTVSLSSIAVGGPNAGDFAATNGCGLSLSAGASCSVSIVATPGALGARTGALAILSNAPQSPQSVALGVTGAAPTAGPVALSPMSLTWDVAGTLQDVTLTNQGLLPLTISGTAIGGSGAGFFTLSSTTCGSTVIAGGSCVLSILSTGIASIDTNDDPATFAATLTITDDAVSSTQTASLSSTNLSSFTGSGVFNAGSIAMGNTQTTLVSQYGGLGHYNAFPIIPATGTGGDFSYTTYQSNASPYGSGGTAACTFDPSVYGPLCELQIAFTPTVTGVRAGKLSVFYPDAASACGSACTGEYILATGTGTSGGASFTAPASIGIATYVPTAPDPNGNAGATYSLPIQNTGTTPFTFSATFTGPNAAMLSAGAGTCTNAAKQTSCNATVTFAPSGTVGTFTATMLVKDANSSATQTVQITATTSYWSIKAAPTSLTFAQQAFGTQSAVQYLTISDANGYPLTHPVSVSLIASSNFTLPQGGTCPASSVQACSIAVAFDPNTSGSIIESATVTDTVSGNTTTVGLTGTGGVATVSLSSSSVTFPSQTVNTTATTSMQLTNSGNATLNIASVSLTGAVNANFTQTNNCGQLSPGSYCTIGITFAPTAVGAQSASIVIVSNAASSPDTLMITGTGAALPSSVASLSPSSVPFNIVGALQDVTLSNLGNVPLTIGTIATQTNGSTTNYFAVSSTTCGSVLSVGATCTVTVTSSGISFTSGIVQPVQYAGTLTVNDSATGGQQTVSLTSTNATYFSSPFVMTETSVGASNTSIYAYTTGSYPASPALIYTRLTGSDSGDFSLVEKDSVSGSSPCGFAVHSTCNVNVTFTPAATGARTANLYLQINDPTYFGEYVLLTGLANGGSDFTIYSPNANIAAGQALPLSAALPLSPDPYSISTQSITITNRGKNTFSLRYSFSGANASIMTLNTNGCTTLAMNASCNVTLSFNPTATGSYAATLLLADANSSVSYSVPVTATVTNWNSVPAYNSAQFSNQAVGTTSTAKNIIVGDSNGYADGHASVVALQAGSQFALPQGGNCAASLTQTCSIPIVFSPTMAGNISETATVTDLVTGIVTNFYPSGIGGFPVVSLSATQLMFPAQANKTTSGAMTFTLTNTGNALLVATISLTGTVNSNFVENSNCGGLNPGSSCTVSITFSPQTTGMQSATVVISSNALSSPNSVTLTGTSQ